MRNALIMGILFFVILFVSCAERGGVGPGENEPPQAVECSITASTDLSISLAWTMNTDSDFASYKIYRAISPDVSTNSNLIATITDQSDTTYTDSSLSPHYTYHYKVYVSDTGGLSSGSNEVQASTSGLASLTIGIEPRKLIVSNGSSFLLTVWVDAVTELFGASFELCYDGTKITADSSTVGNFLGDDVIVFDHFSTDTVSIAVTRKSGAAGVDGYGTLVTIYFHAAGTGASTVNFTSSLALNKENGTSVDGFADIDKWSASIEVQ